MFNTIVQLSLNKDQNMRSGKKIPQPTGYKAFIPANLPPVPSIALKDGLQHLLTDANIAIVTDRLIVFDNSRMCSQRAL